MARTLQDTGSTAVFYMLHDSAKQNKSLDKLRRTALLYLLLKFEYNEGNMEAKEKLIIGNKIFLLHLVAIPMPEM